MARNEDFTYQGCNTIILSSTSALPEDAIIWSRWYACGEVLPCPSGDSLPVRCCPDPLDLDRLNRGSLDVYCNIAAFVLTFHVNLFCFHQVPLSFTNFSR